MKSVKRGRGPSFMEGAAGIFAALFGVIWMIAAASMGAGLFSLFGLVFIGFAVVNAVYSFRNALGEKRYSEYDIVSGDEELDPLNERFGAPQHAEQEGVESRYCPYCGAKAVEGYIYCNKCGKKLP